MKLIIWIQSPTPGKITHIISFMFALPSPPLTLSFFYCKLFNFYTYCHWIWFEASLWLCYIGPSKSNAVLLFGDSPPPQWINIAMLSVRYSKLIKIMFQINKQAAYLIFQIWRFLFLIPQNPRKRTIDLRHYYFIWNLTSCCIATWSSPERDFLNGALMSLKKYNFCYGSVLTL